MPSREERDFVTYRDMWNRLGFNPSFQTFTAWVAIMWYIYPTHTKGGV